MWSPCKKPVTSTPAPTGDKRLTARIFNAGEVIFVSPMEYGLSIGNTYFFLSKLGTKVREVYLPNDSLTIWDKCDVLITANPKLLESKPEGKVSIKIKADYNKECEADYTYRDLSSFITKQENLEELLNGFTNKNGE